MKKKIVSLFVLAFVVLVFASPVYAQSGVVGGLTPASEEGPITLAEYPVLDMLVFAGISWIVTEGLKSLSKLTKVPLEGKATAITGAVVFIAVSLIDAFFGAIPPEYQGVTRNVLTLIIGILTMYGYAGKTRGAKAAKS